MVTCCYRYHFALQVVRYIYQEVDTDHIAHFIDIKPCGVVLPIPASSALVGWSQAMAQNNRLVARYAGKYHLGTSPITVGGIH